MLTTKQHTESSHETNTAVIKPDTVSCPRKNNGLILTGKAHAHADAKQEEAPACPPTMYGRALRAVAVPNTMWPSALPPPAAAPLGISPPLAPSTILMPPTPLALPLTPACCWKLPPAMTGAAPRAAARRLGAHCIMLAAEAPAAAVRGRTEARSL